MSEGKHSDYVWFVVHDGHPGVAIETNKGLRIARVYSDELTHAEIRDNARLIADAPRLKRENTRLQRRIVEVRTKNQLLMTDVHTWAKSDEIVTEERDTLKHVNEQLVEALKRLHEAAHFCAIYKHPAGRDLKEQVSAALAAAAGET